MLELSISEKIVLELLSAAVTNTQPNIDDKLLASADWDTIGLIASHQAVTPMIFDQMAKYRTAIPKEIFIKWYNHILKVLSQNSVVEKAQKELTEILNDKYDYVILKGIAAAFYYNKPELRGLGDVDFLTHKSLAKTITQEITDKGYVNYADNDRHITFKKTGKMLELHRELPGVPYGKKGKMVNDFAKDIYAESYLANCLNNEFKMPSPKHHAAILLLHNAHHLVSEGLGLRHLCDWACFVDKTCNDAFWQTEFIPFTKEIGMYHFASILTKTCSLYLKTACPEWVAADDNVCDELMADILSGGNFGEFDKSRKGSGMMISEHGKGGTKNSKAYNMFRALHTSMNTMYPILNKAPYLYPFIFVWRIIKYLIMMSKGERPSLIAAAKKAEQRRAFYDKLKIFED